MDSLLQRLAMVRVSLPERCRFLPLLGFSLPWSNFTFHFSIVIVTKFMILSDILHIFRHSSPILRDYKIGIFHIIHIIAPFSPPFGLWPFTYRPEDLLLLLLLLLFLFEFFISALAGGFFQQVSSSLLDSSQYSILIIVSFVWSPLILLFPPVLSSILWWLYRVHQLQMVSPSISCSVVFSSSLASSWYLSFFSL